MGDIISNLIICFGILIFVLFVVYKVKYDNLKFKYQRISQEFKEVRDENLRLQGSKEVIADYRSKYETMMSEWKEAIKEKERAEATMTIMKPEYDDAVKHWRDIRKQKEGDDKRDENGKYKSKDGSVADIDQRRQEAFNRFLELVNEDMTDEQRYRYVADQMRLKDWKTVRSYVSTYKNRYATHEERQEFEDRYSPIAS